MSQTGPPSPGTSVIDARVRLPQDRRPAGRSRKPSAMTDRYDAVLGTASTRGRGLAELEADMQAAGVGHAVVHAEYEHGDEADELNEATAKLVAEHPDRFSGFGTVSMTRLEPMRAARQARRVAALGLVGINVQPAFFDVAIDDRRLYPLYAACTELDLAVAVHTGVNYSTVSPIDTERPSRLDIVACHFPGLRLIACHGAWPWVTELVAVMRRHPSVYADFGGLAPRYVGEAGTGWEVLRRFMDGPLSTQVLFATDWPVFPMQRALDEWRSMGLRQFSLARLLAGNITAVLQPEGGDRGTTE